MNNNYIKLKASRYSILLWDEWVLQPIDSRYNIGFVYEIKGDFDYERLQNALLYFINQNPLIRSSFTLDNETLFQILHNKIDNPVEFYDYSGKSKEKLEILIRKLCEYSFDLTKPPLFKIAIIKSENIHYLALRFHHIIIDGTSAQQVPYEISQYYNNNVSDLNKIRLESADLNNYLKLENDFFAKHTLDEGLKYWDDLTRNRKFYIDLPKKKNRIEESMFSVETINFELGNNLTSKIFKLAQTQKCTVFHIMSAFWSIFLHKHSNQENISMLYPVSMRPRELKNLKGYLVNSLPMLVDFSESSTLSDIITQIRDQRTETKKFQHIPFDEVIRRYNKSSNVKYGMRSNNYLNVTVVESNEILSSPINLNGLSTQNIPTQTLCNSELSLVYQKKEDSIKCQICYNNDFLEDFVFALSNEHFLQLIRKFIDSPDKEICSIPILTDHEFRQTVYDWNSIETSFPINKTIQELFEEQVEKTPDNIALVFEKMKFTYRELNEKANQLAHTIRHEYHNYTGKNIKSDDLIGLYIERGVNMIIGILGILKSGAAYVPFDLADPKERLKYKINDCGCKMVVTSSDSLEELVFLAESDTLPLSLDAYQEEIDKAPISNPTLINSSRDIAYVIYTSGSTGKPKGVMTEHYGAVNFIDYHKYKLLPSTENKNIIQSISVNFDASWTEIALSFFTGSSMHLIKSIASMSITELTDYIKKNNINVFVSTPAIINNLPKEDIPCLECLIAGGDVGDKSSMDFWSERIIYYNAYGPTEATICTTYSKHNTSRSNKNIGRPLQNKKLYVLDNRLNPAPIGVPGELYIGGEGLARGYLNRPELTEERFIDNPFVTEEEKQRAHNLKIYKTGDLVRQLQDGSIEFHGRNDDQIKIRGFRVELGEIENKLAEHPSISSCAVICRDNNGSKYLTAYYVLDKTVDSRLGTRDCGELTVDSGQSSVDSRELQVASRESLVTNQKLSDYLAEQVPDYMVPTYFMEMPEMPLTVNGKIDRKKLPEPNIRTITADNYIAPQNNTEKEICKIWHNLLGLEKVGIKDDFFKIGGDSILCIQLCSKLRNSGYAFSVKDIYDKRTVEHLSTSTSEENITVNIDAEQGILEGEFDFLPIQRWFFALDLPKRSHWNQSFLIKVPELNIDELEKKIYTLVQQHDSLRISFKDNTQYYNRNTVLPELKTLNVKGCSKEELSNTLTEWQSHFDLGNSPLWQYGYLYGYEDGTARVYFALHHLITDSVSWRIITEDLKTLLEGGELNEKTSSYRQWVKTVKDYAATHTEEVHFWKEEIERSESFNSEFNTKNEITISEIELDTEKTELLLNKSASAYNTEINDLLLTALAYSVKNITDKNTCMLTLEGHGRENIDDSIDISNTVGWFTTMYPVKLELKDTLANSIKSIKRHLRSIPNKGIGYSTLKYYGPNKKLKEQSLPLIGFNYLGQFDTADNNWQIVSESSGTAFHPDNIINNIISINGMVTAGKLTFSVHSRLSETDTEKLSKALLSNLEEITLHCSEKAENGDVEYTADDFRFVNISQELLTRLTDKYEIENIFPAGSLQQGFVYHVLSNPDDDAYRLQLLLDYHNTLDVAKYAKSWEYAIKKFPILRTCFNWEEEIIQIICKDAKQEFIFHDISNETDKESAVATITKNDRRRNFDLSRPGIFRIHLIRQSQDHYTLLKSEHHSIADGWSIPLVLGFVHETYKELINGKTPQIKVENTYIDAQNYIFTNKDAVQKYWQKNMERFENVNDISALFTTKTPLTEIKEINDSGEISLKIPENNYKELKELCSEHGITLNVLVQFAWHKLLSVYSGDNTTVVGTTVSGRDIPINGIEESVGLYINTLPLIINWNDKSTLEQLHHIHKCIAEVNANSFMDVAQLQKSGERFFHSLFVFENYPDSFYNQSKDGILEYSFREGIEKLDYPLGVVAYTEGNDLYIKLKYAKEYMADLKAEGIMSQVESVLCQIPNMLNQSHSKISILDEKEFNEAIYKFNGTESGYSSGKTIIEVFEDQVLKNSDRPALIFEDKTLSYRELNEKANQLAHTIRIDYREYFQKDITKDTLIGIYIERSLNMIIGMLAILKSGAAYVPFDLADPEERLKLKINDCGCKMVLTSSNSIEDLVFLADEDTLPLSIDEYTDEIEKQPKTNPEKINSSRDLAYIIYTSGSTGRPKGVMLEHYGVINLAESHRKSFEITPDSVILQFAPVSFDASVSTLFCALLNGAELCLCSEEDRKDVTRLCEFINKHKITLIDIPAKLFELIPHDFDTSNLEYVITAGEVCDRRTMDYWCDKVKLINAYGPTESTVCTTFSIYTKDKSNSNIGKPIANKKVYVLDSNLNPVPTGVPGELFIGGDGLARGYFNRPEITEERFIKDSFLKNTEDSDLHDTRMYKTGDIVRRLNDGSLEFIGRNDDQVKIHGYRIELGEIEKKLSEHDSILLCAVKVYERENNKQLCAYYTINETNRLETEDSRLKTEDLSADSSAIASASTEALAKEDNQQSEINNQKLKDYLSAQLPDYMVPAYFVKLDSFPMNTSGKIDRKALPEPTLTSDDSNYVPPSNKTEEELCSIWQEVLGLDKVGINDDFFKSGGNSILAIKVIHEMSKFFEQEISVAEISAYKTVSDFAAHINKINDSEGIELEDEGEEIELFIDTVYTLFYQLQKKNIAIWYDNNKLKAFLPKGKRILSGERSFLDSKKTEILRILKENEVFSKEVFRTRKIFKGIQTTYPLSFAQERLWFIEQYEKGSTAYNIPIAFDLDNDIEIESFIKSINDIVTRHEVLRTVFRKDEEGSDYQLISDTSVNMQKREIREYALYENIKNDIDTKFDLVNQGPLKVFIYTTEKSTYSLLLIHHIAFDGWSTGIFIDELEKLYQNYKKAKAVKLPDQDIQYKDFALWQKEYLTGEVLEKQLAYWKSKISDCETVEFPTDRNRPPHSNYTGDNIYFEINPKTTKKIKMLSKETGITLYSILLSTFYILLNKYTGQNDLIIGSPAANRNYSQLKNIIGFFVNSIALRANLAPNSSFRDLINQTQRNVTEAQNYQDLPFEKLVDALDIDQDMSRHPIFQIMFGLNSFELKDDGLFKVLLLNEYYKPAKFDLSLFIDAAGDSFKGTFNYALSLFDTSIIERLKNHYLNILEQITENTDIKIEQINILSESEYNKIVYDWNSNEAKFQSDKTVVELFEEQVERTPNATAVMFENKKLTYQELNRKANQLAHTLRRDYQDYFKIEITGDTLIGIYIDRSLEMVIGILGILKSGAAYVPFDSADPEDRLKFKVNDSGCNVVLTVSDNVSELVFLAETDKIPIALDGYADEIEKASVENPTHISRPDNLAYIIYTSGSTGRPKGVMLENRSVVNYAANFEYFINGKNKIFDLSSSLSFDLTVTTTLVPLLTGNCIAVYPGELKDIDTYIKHIEDKKVTFIKTVPSLLYLLLQKKKHKYLKEIFVGGEKLNRELLVNTEGIKIYDEYGPTEATVGTTISNVCPSNQSGIGKPYNNYKVYILGANCIPVPVGVVGEMYIGGDCLARGYLNRPKLTAERFIRNPFLQNKTISNKQYQKSLQDTDRYALPCASTKAGIVAAHGNASKITHDNRMYKTGDIARWFPDGNIEYIGRNDDQVKIRGFRIEPGEIETRLSEHPSVDQCAVVCREHNGNKILAAYYILNKTVDNRLETGDNRLETGDNRLETGDNRLETGDNRLETGDNRLETGDNRLETENNQKLTEYLFNLLPEYMVPSYFMLLDKMPLTPNGKVNRRALPEPEFKADENSYTAPRNDTEKQLCSVWAKILDTDVGIDDDFFKLGGNSILAIKTAHKMSELLNREIPVAYLFDKKNIRCISDTLTDTKGLIKIEPCNKNKVSLSFAQERLYFIEEYEGGSNAYNIPLFFKLKPETNITTLKKAISSIVQRHEVLRTVFKKENGKTYQRVIDSPFKFDETEVQVNKFQSKLLEDVNKIFNLNDEHPVKVTFYKKNSEKYILINIHHIAFDGWSTDIFLKELNAFYHHFNDGVELQLPEMEIQYKDFAVWQKEYLSGERLANELNYWKNELEDYETLEFPIDKTRPSEISYEGDFFVFELDAELSQKIRNTVKQFGTTPYTVLLSAFYIFLQKYTGQNDIVIGSPTANRHYRQLENLIGFFVNSTVLRCKFTSETDIKSLIKKTASTLGSMQQHQDLPFEKLIEEFNIPKDPSRHPLIQMMFSVQDFGNDSKTDNIDFLTPVNVSDSYKVSKYDLSLFMDDSGENISGCFNYAVSLFERSTIARMADHYINILNNITSGENKLVNDIQLLTYEEYNRIVYEFNGTESNYSSEKTIIEIFEEQVLKNPDRPALIFEDKTLSYRELNEKANQLAHTIRIDYREYFQKDITKDTLIGIYIERSLNMIIGMLAILKSGAAYVPFDLADPEERLKLKINDCGCKMVLTSSNSIEDLVFLADEDTLPLSIDEYTDEIEKQPKTNPEKINSSRDLAYIIYTSGSTGRPKGVMLEHYGVINLAESHRKSFEITPDSVILQFAPVSFDASVSTLFCTLLNGAELCLCSEEDRKDVTRLCEFINKHKITLIDIPAKLFELIPHDFDTSNLEYVITAGEVCDRRTMDYWCDKVKLINAYGPTESTVCTTFSIYTKDKSNSNIGKPISNKKVYVLDSNLNPVPTGVPGELFIGGDGLARGYFNRPEITEERFIKDSFLKNTEDSDLHDTRMYKTGDIVRRLNDGSLEFIGRNDDQVKIHGYRIELGEIEKKLSEHYSILLCAVKVYERENNKQLCAYYTINETNRLETGDCRLKTADNQKSEINNQKLKDYLSAQLPDYMVPAYFVKLDSFPVNTSGKIDRKALPEPTLTSDDSNYVPPRNKTEEELCSIWQEVLGLDKVGINDDFFRIGGDSILSIQLNNRLREEGIDCSVKDLFKNSTVEKLALHITENSSAKVQTIAEKGILEGEFDLLPIQHWFFENIDRGTLPKYNHWNQSFMVKVPLLDIDKLNKGIALLVSYHDALRLTFENGKQKYNSSINIPELKVLDKNTISDTELFETFTGWQSHFDIEEGPLWQIGYIYGYEDGTARLYFALHHLIVDAVSWRILIEDIKKCYEGTPLFDKTSSYRQWVNTVKSYLKNNPDETEYWKNIIISLPDYNKHHERNYNHSVQSFTLNKEITKQLIKEANGAYSTEVNDLLLTAFAYSLKVWNKNNIQGLTLEGHGRVNIDDTIDHTHTVGWFTNTYPVKLELKDNIEKSIISTKDSLRLIPNKGIGFGAYRYYENIDSNTGTKYLPPISFNYLGQIDSGSNEVWQFSGDASGQSINSENIDPNLITVNGIVIDDKLRFQVETRLGKQMTKIITERFEDSLKEITEHCIKIKEIGQQKNYNADDFEYIPYILLNKEAKSSKLIIMIHPDSGYEAYMASLYPAISKDVKVVLVDNFYTKKYLADGVTNQKYNLNSFKDLAEYYVDLLTNELEDLLIDSECHLLGYSFGCPIAYEMAPIFKKHSININSFYMIDPLIQGLLKRPQKIDCLDWYNGYTPAPTNIPITHFRCSIPDKTLPNCTEYFIDSNNASMKPIAENLEEITIDCYHTQILNNQKFISEFKERVNIDLDVQSIVEEHKHLTQADSSIENEIKEILLRVIKPEANKIINSEENIFQLGCSSMQVLSIISMVNEKYKVNLNISDIIQDFTIKGLASSIIKSDNTLLKKDVWKPVEFNSKRTDSSSLYFFPGFIGSVSSYNKMCNLLSDKFNVIFFEPKGMYGSLVPFKDYNETISAYVDEIIRANSPNDKVYLAGHSVGSIHSLDTALQLEEKGYKNISLINIDGYLHKMDDIKKSLGTDDPDQALIAVLKLFFGKENENTDKTEDKDPLQEIASILFPSEDVNKDYALRVAHGYRNIWHKQVTEMIEYQEPKEEFKGNALVLIAKESNLEDDILKSCDKRYSSKYIKNYISGNHLSCITQKEFIQELCNCVFNWRF